MRSAPLLLAVLLAACSRADAPAGKSLPDVKLQTLGGPAASLASCPTQNCLTVYVAPWCPYCRGATAAIRDLKAHLAPDVDVRVIVGMDRLDAVRAYAREFGPLTLLDPENSVAVKGGVPHFYVSDKTGRVLREVPGLPPFSRVDELARYFGFTKG